jgi:hypothetical protein
MIRTSWRLYRVSPLWNVQYKKNPTNKCSNLPPLDTSELSVATRQEYDKVAPVFTAYFTLAGLQLGWSDSFRW